ncbi:hypothetical protein PWG15_07145 [Ensifer adhaerens]|uniref:hypothetical protein n=1 Tax=Ensifer adhaerens TaxID=106592 RepID=UPI0023A9D4B9|nr:hypothetical protein [Ensifer adhaerens]WDZ78259.1 hypothetical protein PWG15_07145 [Ensifer adhaerens]
MNIRRGLFRIWLIASVLWVLILAFYVDVEGRGRAGTNEGSIYLHGWAVVTDGWKAEKEAASVGEASTVPDEIRSRILVGREVQMAALLFGALLLGPPLVLLVLGVWVIRG